MTFLVSKTVRENNPLILNKSFTLFQHKQTKKKRNQTEIIYKKANNLSKT